MSTGRITGSNVNFRNGPGGDIVRQLALNTQVEILQADDDWIRVAVDGQPGYVSAQYVKADAASAPAAEIPPPDDGTIEADANSAYTPDHQPFASRFRLGFFTRGQTTIADFLASASGQAEFGDTAPSLRNVINAVSRNEGRLEAINSYDNAFLSFGTLQWTAGSGAAQGELAALLARLKQRAPDAFETYFGRYGIDMVGAAGLRTGFLSLNGETLRTQDQKEQLREALWAYRFWRAGHDPAVRACQLAHALARIDQFYPGPARDGLPVKAFVSSEQGVALLLDEHVNRPGHVPGTLLAAIDAFIGGGAADDPAAWGDQEEAQLLALYVERRNSTNMTDSSKRAQQIADVVAAGQLSGGRGSFRL